MVVSNRNIVVDAKGFRRKSRRTRQRGRGKYTWRANEAKLLALIARFRREIEALACSSAWAEDCLYRGVNYVPDFRCACNLCRDRYPKRRFPQPAKESSISIDCQVEAEVDPELAEDLARLRNEPVRSGSIFIANRHTDRGSGTTRRNKSKSPLQTTGGGYDD
jgi:hypothetical protein